MATSTARKGKTKIKGKKTAKRRNTWLERGAHVQTLPPAMKRFARELLKKEGDRSEVGREIEQGLREAVSIAEGQLEAPRRFNLAEFRNAFVHRTYGSAEIRDLRSRLGLSQSMLAAIMDTSTRAVTNWEQEIRKPDGPSRRLLQLIDAQPEVLKFLLQKGTTEKVGG